MALEMGPSGGRDRDAHAVCYLGLKNAPVTDEAAIALSISLKAFANDNIGCDTVSPARIMVFIAFALA